jgi:predicted nucleotidyltransferase/uncharacterized protein (UPF0332 family)
MVKNNKKNKSIKKISSNQSETKEVMNPIAKGMEDIPPEARKKLEGMKKHLEEFKDKVLERFEENVLGIALLPPNEEKKEDINVLVLIEDTDSTKTSKEELYEKLNKNLNEMAKSVEKNLVIHPRLLTQVYAECFDGKYDSLQMIAMSAPVYDGGMLGALKICEIHKSMVLKKFEKYIVSYVLGGSITKGKAHKDSDIDVFVIIDDTDVKKMTRIELRDKLRAIIIGMVGEAGEITGIRNKLSIQVWLLTDYWDSIKDAHPVMFTFLRDGIPFYDRGMFMPWKQLLEMGRIKPSPEAIEMFMHSGFQMMDRISMKLKDMVMEDLFYAVLNPSQAALMMYGIAPTTPRETFAVMREIFVKKEKLLEEKFVKTLEKVVNTHKDIEYGRKTKITGTELDELVKESDEYLRRLGDLFKEIEEKKMKEDIVTSYENIITVARDVLKTVNIESVDDKSISVFFKEQIVKKGLVPERFGRLLDEIIQAKKDFDLNKLSKTEIAEVKKTTKELITGLVEFIQRKRGEEIEKTKLRVKYGKKFAEIILLEEVAFISYDLDSEEKKVTKAKLTKLGSIVDEVDSSIEELESALMNQKMPKKAFIKNALFDDIKKIFGKDVEILVNY